MTNREALIKKITSSSNGELARFLANIGFCAKQQCGLAGSCELCISGWLDKEDDARLA